MHKRTARLFVSDLEKQKAKGEEKPEEGLWGCKPSPSSKAVSHCLLLHWLL
ncbi:hypothetical protein ACGTN9_08630 [Halobacillus sp. MO56]